MSTYPKQHNVISLSKVDPMKRATYTVLIGSVRTTAQKRLSSLVVSLFDNVDDALFDMAERASSNSNQALYFEGMREIRKKRQRAETLWHEFITRLFGDFEDGNLAPSSDEIKNRGGDELGPLALVEDAALEESIAIDAMVDKAETRLSKTLHALNQRFIVLAGQRKVDQANNPLGPYLLCVGFSDCLREFEIELQVKLIVLKLFERHVIGGLEALHDDVNALLMQSHVLPDLRHSLPNQRNAERSKISSTPENNSTPTVNDQPVQSQAGVSENIDSIYTKTDSEILSLVDELHNLLASRRNPTAATPVASLPTTQIQTGRSGLNAAPTSARELLNALSLMQSELQAQRFAQHEGNIQPIEATPQHIKQMLVQNIRQLGGGSAHHTALGSDENTIDLVGLLFEYALQDKNVPAPIQAQLARLQIPYLKVALMDKGFIAHKTHPARKLLDDMAQASMGWSEESDKDHRLYNKIQEIVTSLLKDFDDDTGIFEKLAADFSDFVEKNRKRAELIEKRTTESARGRERLETAQRTAAHAILSRISGHQLPEAVRELLTRRWSNYMVLTYLRHGEDSSEWRAATRFIDDFAWSVQPKKDEHERLRLRDKSPEIERLLKQGLSSTGFHESHVDELWKEVSALYEEQITGITRNNSEDLIAQIDAATQALPEESKDKLTIRFASSRAGEEVTFSQSQIQNEPDDDTDYAATQALDTWLKMAKALKAGTWFEFINDDGSRERAKLLWISTIKALYLFVNRNGLKIAEKTANELAAELKNQKTVILEQAALVDRALDAILHKLKDSEEISQPESTQNPTAPDDQQQEKTS
jgi:hypothetical protein